MKAVHHNMKVGAKQSTKSILGGRAKLVYLAEDADLFLSTKIISICKENNVKVEFVPSKSALGRMCGIDVPSAVAVEE